MRDHAQRRPPLPVRLTPAKRDFHVELRRLVDAAGLSLRALEESTSAARSDSGESAFYSKSQWGRWLNGQSQPPRKAVRKLAGKLREEDIDAKHLVDLWDRAFVPALYPQAPAATVATPSDIKRPDAAMPGRPSRQAEADLPARYRRHVTGYHGMPEPPDSEYRRVPVADLHVTPDQPPAGLADGHGAAALPQLPAAVRHFAGRQAELATLVGQLADAAGTVVPPALHRAIVCVDVEGFSDRCRTNPDQLAVRAALYDALRQAFTRSGIPWDGEDCYREDRGDGALILISPRMPKNLLAAALPPALAAVLREHNQAAAPETRIKLRIALHAGEVHHDDHGVAATAINHSFRLLEAGPPKRALRDSPGTLALIASQWFFEEVIRHDRATAATYRQVEVSVKEIQAPAWICLPEDPGWPGRDITRPSPGATVPGQPPHRQAAGSTGADTAGGVAGPALFTVPPRNRHFTGRSQLLDQIRAGLAAGRPVAVTALHGLGGIGKTQLAIEYAHRHAADYQLVWWVDAEQTPLLAGQLAALTSHLGLPGTGRVTTDAAAVLNALRRRDRWLLVFDNAEHPAALRPWLPDGPGHTLITSRYPAWGGLADPVEVDILTRAEAVTLLARRVPHLSPQVADAMSDELGDLPLALEQAAAYLETTGIPPAGYLDRLRTRRDQMLARGHDLAHGGTIYTVWSLALDSLRDQEPAAVALLDLCAHFGPEPIPLALIEDHPDLLDEPLRRIVAGSDPATDLNDVLGAVLAYSCPSYRQHHPAAPPGGGCDSRSPARRAGREGSTDSTGTADCPPALTRQRGPSRMAGLEGPDPADPHRPCPVPSQSRRRHRPPRPPAPTRRRSDPLPPRRPPRCPHPHRDTPRAMEDHPRRRPPRHPDRGRRPRQRPAGPGRCRGRPRPE
jgi:hypothetical protein